MKLNKYVAKEVKDREVTKTAVLRELSEKSKVSLITLQGAERGARMGTYEKAKAVSEATGGKVTIKDLCE